MEEINKLELIEKYLEGQLSGQQLTDIENRMHTDATFLEEVEWQRKAVGQLSDPGMRLFQERLQNYQQEKN